MCGTPAGHLPLPLLAARGAEHDDVPATRRGHDGVGELLLLGGEVSEGGVPEVGGPRGGDSDLPRGGVLHGVLAAEAVEHARLFAAVRRRHRLARDGVADAAEHAVLLKIRPIK